jgi:hypothetical protein
MQKPAGFVRRAFVCCGIKVKVLCPLFKDFFLSILLSHRRDTAATRFQIPYGTPLSSKSPAPIFSFLLLRLGLHHLAKLRQVVIKRIGSIKCGQHLAVIEQNKALLAEVRPHKKVFGQRFDICPPILLLLRPFGHWPCFLGARREHEHLNLQAPHWMTGPLEAWPTGPPRTPQSPLSH